ncbi:MAG: hypothetical protein ACREF0_20155 [Acetobacteraceae bacterium]
MLHPADPSVAPRPAAAPLAIERVSGFLKIAGVLIDAGRRIDLDGLEGEIGRLCAAVLDLDPAAGRALKPRLSALMAELDAIEARLAAHQGASAHGAPPRGAMPPA